MQADSHKRFSVGSDSTLQGDRKGNLRLLVVGNSGTGKSTMAAELAKILSIPIMHLDQLYWRPGWSETPDDQFREAVASFIRHNDNWIIDGNYKRVVGDMTTSHATTIIWLDPPFALYFTRLIFRTLLRLLRLNPPCSPGCDESLSDVLTLGEKSILWWSWTNHGPQRELYINEMKKAEGIDDGRWIRLGGWGTEVQRWLARVRMLAKGM